ncbi:EpsG family protein [Qipengyuania atrilutea]|uniref:EpsG family protein n=1 Tax=Qipengyuania atrilutea TaxID=2744473 RepID=A0A850HBF4_9SPHN|nr:EpsG family protein [Actirhodobacter atriluteus]NVD44399.1 EpsG family protein [Actirhodobacter atriluteus]
MPSLKINRTYQAVAVAFLFCGVFFAVDWLERFPYNFPDLSNYREGFSSGWYLFSVINLDWLRFFLSEGTWVYGFDALWRELGDIETSFLVVSFASLLLISTYVLRQSRSAAPLIFFINPAFIHLIVEQLRSGLACGLFFTAVQAKSHYAKIPLFLLAASIHTSFLLFLSLYYLYLFTKKTRIIVWLTERYAVFFMVLFALALTLAFFRDAALSAIDDNRAFILEDQTSGILLGIAWSTFIVSYMILRNNKQFDFNFYFFVLNIMMFIASIFAGEYGARFVSVAIPALAVLSQDVPKERRHLFYFQYVLFSTIYFVIWANG